MKHLSPRGVPIAHSQTFVAALLVTMLLSSGCAATGPERNGGATANNSVACQRRSDSYHQSEIEVPCGELAVRSREGSAQLLGERAKTALYSVGLLALLYLLSDSDDNGGSCYAWHVPISCDSPWRGR